MATIALNPHADLSVPLPADRRVQIITWASPLATGDVGEPIEIPEATDRAIEFTGNFDGATVVLEVSILGTDWFTATEAGTGVAISYIVKDYAQIEEAARYMRPRVTGGGGSTAIIPAMIVKR